MAKVRRMSSNQRGSLRLAPRAGVAMPDDVAAEATIRSVAATVTSTESHVTVNQTPTITVGAYGLGDAVGGLLTFAGATNGATAGGVLKTLTLIDRGQQEVALDLVLFDQTFTASVDNAVFAPSNADLANSISVIHILPAHFARFATNSQAQLGFQPDGLLDLYFTSVLNANVYGQLVNRGLPTYASTGDLTLRLTFKRN